MPSGDSAWVASALAPRLTRIDRASNGVVGTFPIVAGTSHLLADGDQIWAYGVELQGVDRFDTGTLRAEARTAGMRGLALLDRVLWGTVPDSGAIVAMDPETLEARVAVDLGGFEGGEMLAAEGRLWVNGFREGEDDVLPEVRPEPP